MKNVQINIKQDKGVESFTRKVIQETTTGYHVAISDQSQWDTFGLPKSEWFPKQSKNIWCN